MKFNRCYKSHTSASAPCANAGTSCTHSADNGIIAVLDAILVASIIIYGLIVLLGLRLVTLLANHILLVKVAILIHEVGFRLRDGYITRSGIENEVER